MLIAIDIGNTNVCVGFFEGRKLVREFRMETDKRAAENTILRGWKRLLPARWRRPVEGIVLASVVPEVEAAAASAAAGIWAAPVLRVDPAMPLPIKNAYQPGRAAGVDRLMNAVAAAAAFGTPVIAVDFGTAITLDAVSANRRFLGGAILPGPVLSLAALVRGTSQIKPVSLKTPSRALGRSTQSGLRSGLIWGAAGAVDHLVRKIRQELGGRATAVATGGLARMIAPHCREIHRLVPDLTLQGLRLTWLYTQARGVKP